MKSREDWLMEWGQVPTWVRVFAFTLVWLAVLAVASLEMELRQAPVRRPASQDARHETAWR